jgi:hypothetical protein
MNSILPKKILYVAHFVILFPLMDSLHHWMFRNSVDQLMFREHSPPTYQGKKEELIVSKGNRRYGESTSQCYFFALANRASIMLLLSREKRN